MKRIILSLIVVGLSLGLAEGASAQGTRRCAPRGVNQRQRHQQVRIYRGVGSGELTRRETLRLEREQNQIQRLEWRAKSDGDVTARERARLQKELNQSSRHIYRAKHNDSDRN